LHHQEVAKNKKNKATQKETKISHIDCLATVDLAFDLLPVTSG